MTSSSCYGSSGRLSARRGGGRPGERGSRRARSLARTAAPRRGIRTARSRASRRPHARRAGPPRPARERCSRSCRRSRARRSGSSRSRHASPARSPPVTRAPPADGREQDIAGLDVAVEQAPAWAASRAAATCETIATARSGASRPTPRAAHAGRDPRRTASRCRSAVASPAAWIGTMFGCSSEAASRDSRRKRSRNRRRARTRARGP